MNELIEQLNAKETELTAKLDALRRTRELFAERDAASQAKVGSLAPVVTDQLRQMFTDGKPRGMAEIFAELKGQGYDGTEARVRGAVRRLMDTGELKRRGKGYVGGKKAA